MKNAFLCVASLCLCIAIVSCQKDFIAVDSPVVPPVTNPHDSLLRLSMVVYFDGSAAANDTAGIVEFKYDSLQRVSFINSYEFNNGVRDLYDFSRMYYAGADTIPYKSDITDALSFDVRNEYFFYDNSHRLIKDSLINVDSHTYVDRYNYLPGKIVGIYEDDDGSIASTDTGYISANGNIDKVISTDPAIGRNVTTTFSYDDHINPYNQLNLRNTYPPVTGVYYDFDEMTPFKNNVISHTYKDLLFAGSISNNIFEYTYNSYGLPATLNTYYNNRVTISDKIVFVYKKI